MVNSLKQLQYEFGKNFITLIASIFFALSLLALYNKSWACAIIFGLVGAWILWILNYRLKQLRKQWEKE